MISRLLALMIILLAHPAVSQSSTCAAEWTKLIDTASASFGMAKPAPSLFRQTANGGCRTSGLEFKINEHVAIKADSLSWSGRDMDRFVETGLPPTALELTVSGIRIVPQVGDPTFQFLQDIQTRGQNIGVTLSLDWEAETRELFLRYFTISLPSDDYVRVTARVEGVDMSSAESLAKSAATFGLTDVGLEVRTTRIFQDYLLFVVGMALLDGHPDPAARMAELKAIGRTGIDAAPGDVLSETSKAALKRLVDDMPEPAGLLRITQTANPGLGVARGLLLSRQSQAIKSVDDLGPLIDGITLDVTYDRF